VWVSEAGELDRLDELREKLRDGDFKTLTEAATYFGVTSSAVTKYKQKGVRIGLWTDREIGTWLAHGARLRSLKQREAPLSPVPLDEQWEGDDGEDDF